MKTSEIKSKTDEELNNLLADLYQERFNHKMQKATGQLSKPDQVIKVKRDIAKVFTIKKERRNVV
jgi:large subunit ribosomal protein L29